MSNAWKSDSGILCRALRLACDRISDGPQSYEEAKSATDLYEEFMEEALRDWDRRQKKRSMIYNDAVRSATKVLSRVNGRPPKKSVVRAVAKRLVESIPASSAGSSSERPTDRRQ